MIVAIDGPAGAGKSTIALNVAKRLGFQLIDTGAIYRTVALKATQMGIDIDDGPACAQLAADLEFEFKVVDGNNFIICNGETLGTEIRTPEVSRVASVVSAHPEVRQALLNIQRDLGRARDSVLEGRDIGTVVFPDAEVKVFLTASDTERAQRRVKQLGEQGSEANYEDILSEIRERDARDSSRSAAPLRQADDAVAIDSTKFGIDDVVAQVVALVRSR
jgi:cytidylate kinase